MSIVFTDLQNDLYTYELASEAPAASWQTQAGTVLAKRLRFDFETMICGHCEEENASVLMLCISSAGSAGM